MNEKANWWQIVSPTKSLGELLQELTNEVFDKTHNVNTQTIDSKFNSGEKLSQRELFSILRQNRQIK